MNCKRSRRLVLAIVSFGVLFTAGTSVVVASTKNIPFNFNIKVLNTNTRTGPKYRQTTNTENKWMVDLQTSTEGGTGSITTFWLETANTANVSDSFQTKQGSGAHGHDAYASASRQNVYLTAENNNTDMAVYGVTGLWNEEGYTAK